MNKKNYIIPVFVPHFGCPNDCIFCNQRKITNQEESISEKALSDYIEKYFSYIPKTAKNKEVAFYDALDREWHVCPICLARRPQLSG